MTVSSNHQHPIQGSVRETLAVADDPCEVVEEAIPALVIGDLPSTDERCITEHCEVCNSCRTVLSAWETGLSEPELPQAAAPPEPAVALGLHAGHYGLMESPVGDLLIVVTDDGVADISYLANRGREERFAELEERGIIATERSSLVEPVREAATGVLRPPPIHVHPAGRPLRDNAVHAVRTGGDEGRSLRSRMHLSNDREGNRQARSVPGGRQRARSQPGSGDRAVPPCDPRRRIDGLVHRRRAHQAEAARYRGRLVPGQGW